MGPHGRSNLSSCLCPSKSTNLLWSHHDRLWLHVDKTLMWLILHRYFPLLGGPIMTMIFTYWLIGMISLILVTGLVEDHYCFYERNTESILWIFCINVYTHICQPRELDLRGCPKALSVKRPSEVFRTFWKRRLFRRTKNILLLFIFGWHIVLQRKN